MSGVMTLERRSMHVIMVERGSKRAVTLEQHATFGPATQVRNAGGRAKQCLDWAAHGNKHANVGLFWCHEQGGNQVMSERSRSQR